MTYEQAIEKMIKEADENLSFWSKQLVLARIDKDDYQQREADEACDMYAAELSALKNLKKLVTIN